MVIATLAFVDDKHGLGRINAAVKRAFFCSLKRRFTAYRLEQGRREGRAEEENCCLLVSSGIDDSGCREGVFRYLQNEQPSRFNTLSPFHAPLVNSEQPLGTLEGFS
jgi:hypothetical protein